MSAAQNERRSERRSERERERRSIFNRWERNHERRSILALALVSLFKLEK